MIRAGEGPLAAAIQAHRERVEAEQRVARAVLDAGGADVELEELEARLPTVRKAPLLHMDGRVARGFPFVDGRNRRRR